MILLLGGTSEGYAAGELLARLGHPYLYSTRGDEARLPPGAVEWLRGGLAAAEMERLLRERSIRLIVHAGHPFAEGLHASVDLASLHAGVPVLRVQRAIAPLDLGPFCGVVDTWSALLSWVDRQQCGPFISFCGVRSIPRLLPAWKRLGGYFVVLDRPGSRAEALQAGVPADALLFREAPHFTAKIGALKPRFLLSKQSGEAGFQEDKVGMACTLGIPLLFLSPPSLPAHFRVCEMDTLREVLCVEHGVH